MTFFILFILLLNPERKKKEKVKDYPKIVFLQDHSSSIILNYDSSFYKTQYLPFLDSLFQSFNLDVDMFYFDSSMETKFSNFDGLITDISSVLSQTSDIYKNSNVGAYILASDGIYNHGFNPLYINSNLNAPLHTLLLGDTTHHRDLGINSIRSNKISYLGNKTPVEIGVKAHQMNGANVILEVFHHSSKKLVYSNSIEINTQHYFNQFTFFLSPQNNGVQRYYARLKSDLSERNTYNNSEDFFLDVIDDRKKILILYANPHPDVNAIKHGLENFDQYEVDAKWLQDVNSSSKSVNYNKYSLIIMHQLSQRDILDNMFLKDTPIWYIVGVNSDLALFNDSQKNVTFIESNAAFEFSNFELNRNFSAFSISDSLSDFLSLSSPFLVPFSNISINNLSDVLLYKKIGSLNTEQPLLFLVEEEDRIAYLIGEGIWRWKFNDSYLNENNHLFNTFISKITQYLLADQSKKRFHVNYKPIQSSNQRIIFEAELYNKNFELINSADVEIDIVDSLGNSYNYKFNPLENYYYLDVELSAGVYDISVQANTLNEILHHKGKITVTSVSIEERKLIADHNLLYNLALRNNGSVTTLDSLSQLLERITKSTNFTPRTYINYSFKSLISFESLLILILLLLFMEWGLRRRYINY